MDQDIAGWRTFGFIHIFSTYEGVATAEAGPSAWPKALRIV